MGRSTRTVEVGELCSVFSLKRKPDTAEPTTASYRAMATRHAPFKARSNRHVFPPNRTVFIWCC